MLMPKDGVRPTILRRNESSSKQMMAIFFIKSGLIKSIPLESGASIEIH